MLKNIKTLTYNSLLKQFNKDVKQLQSNCEHKCLTGWADEWYAPGHSTGYVVRHCKRCNKLIKRQGGIYDE